MGIEPGPLIASDSKSNTFACKTETLGSIYCHVLLIPLKSSKSKYQVVHEQQFKDLLSSTCQVSVEMRVLDLESEVMRGPGSIPTWGRGSILSLDFFYLVKPPMPILALLPMLCVCENPDWQTVHGLCTKFPFELVSVGLTYQTKFRHTIATQGEIKFHMILFIATGNMPTRSLHLLHFKNGISVS